MFRLRDGAEKEGFHATYVSVADVTTEIAFVERLYEAAQKLAPAKKAIRHIAKGPLGRFLRRIKKSAAILKGVMDKHFQDPAQRDDKLRYLLDVLQADGYLVEAGGRFLFRSSLLRDFWLRRVSL
jgi:hypothetical protein